MNTNSIKFNLRQSDWKSMSYSQLQVIFNFQSFYANTHPHIMHGLKEIQ